MPAATRSSMRSTHASPRHAPPTPRIALLACARYANACAISARVATARRRPIRDRRHGRPAPRRMRRQSPPHKNLHERVGARKPCVEVCTRRKKARTAGSGLIHHRRRWRRHSEVAAARQPMELIIRMRGRLHKKICITKLTTTMWNFAHSKSNGAFCISDQSVRHVTRYRKPFASRVKPLTRVGKRPSAAAPNGASRRSAFRFVQRISRPLRCGLQCRIESESGNAGVQAWNAK